MEEGNKSVKFAVKENAAFRNFFSSLPFSDKRQISICFSRISHSARSR